MMSKNHVVILLITFLCFFSCKRETQKQLPIYNPSDINPELVDISLQETSKNHTVSDFELINQNGKIITHDDYKDKTYVVDFFFTRCSSICPIMTNNLVELQNDFLNYDEVKFLSISVTPDIDSVAVLRQYATDKGVIDSKWNITTGKKKHIYDLARKSYFAVSERGDGGLQDFIHTPNFILVDRKNQIRGIYDGTEKAEILRLAKDIKSLIN